MNIGPLLAFFFSVSKSEFCSIGKIMGITCIIENKKEFLFLGQYQLAIKAT